MAIRFVEDIYADFLFDCYIANQHLTDEDWLYYGKEEHHIEIPNRDGGVLNPLNSQYLTTYQHWVAGVLQSEVLGKSCFAYVPKGVLPPMFEMLRLKWVRFHVNNQPPEVLRKRIEALNSVKHLSGCRTPEAKEKMLSTRLKNQGTLTPKNCYTPEARAKALESKRRNGTLTKGLHTPEAIKKQAKSHQREIEITFPNGRIGVYPSVKFAILSLGVSPSTLNYLLKGKVGSYARLKGFTARYL